MGILRGNKGLNPKLLVLISSNLLPGYMEDDSMWESRPVKVMLSYYAEGTV
jgi:hypothetical protein